MLPHVHAKSAAFYTQQRIKPQLLSTSLSMVNQASLINYLDTSTMSSVVLHVISVYNMLM